MEKQTISVQELASQLVISVPKAYELTKPPGFSSIRIGTRIIIPIEEFKRWLKDLLKLRINIISLWLNRLIGINNRLSCKHSSMRLKLLIH